MVTDMAEEFDGRTRSEERFRARWWYRGQVTPFALLAKSALYSVSPVDSHALLGSLGGLIASTLAAAVAPGRRAAHADPMRILREEYVHDPARGRSRSRNDASIQ